MWYRYAQQQYNAFPPVHDRCHCHIDTLPGGRQIWQFNDNACPVCKSLAHTFNKKQSEIYDQQPAVMPSTEAEPPTDQLEEPSAEDTTEQPNFDQTMETYFMPRRLIR